MSVKLSCLGSRFALACLALIALSTSACVLGSDEAPNAPVATDGRQDAIINGSLDTTRDAVVAIFTGNSLCTGTIIQTDVSTGTGWVLTAAHCVDDDAPEVVAIGSNFNNADVYHEVTSYQAHPLYDPNDFGVYDIAMIQFRGANSTTPVIPVQGAPDGLSEGDPITSVGYGRTRPTNEPASDNSRRRQYTTEIGSLTESLLGYRLDQGGICVGDSGGPVLKTIGGQERVVAVHSFGTFDCTGGGFSNRVQQVYESWLLPLLQGDDTVFESCDTCINTTLESGACSGTWNTCLNDEDCLGLLECLNGCSDNACSDQCAQTYEAGIDGYVAILDCICDTGCSSECAGESVCQGGGGGGDNPPPQTCDTCVDDTLNGGACSGTWNACINDNQCLGLLECLNECTTDACTNQCAQTYEAGIDGYVAILDCICDTGCDTECASAPICQGGGGGGGGPACGVSFADAACDACNEDFCCQDTLDCLEDGTCEACLYGEASASACENNSRFVGLVSCLEGSCADACGFETPDERVCGFTSGDQACSSCIEGSCCALSDQCYNDTACSDCILGDGLGCEDNALLDDFLSCLGSCQGDPCDVGEVPDNPNNGGPNNGTNNGTTSTNNGTTSANNGTGGTNNGSTGTTGDTGGDANNGGGGFVNDDNTTGFLGDNNNSGGGASSGGCSTTGTPQPAPVPVHVAWGLLAAGAFAFIRRRR